MKAAVLHGKEDVRIETVPVRPLQSGEVRIAIEAALTCGTDLKVFKRGYHARMIVPPAVFGHELAGRICEIADITGWQVGDRVTTANSAPCGACFFCEQGQENLCDDLLFLNGAYAESIVIPRRIVKKNLLRLKPETTFVDAALVEPLACVVQGLEETGPREGDRLLIIGSGPIGLMFAALAKHRGCTVTVAGRGDERLQTARRLGADHVVTVASTQQLVEAADSLFPAKTGRDSRPDIVIEAVGKPETWEAASLIVRKGGRVNFFGGCPSGTTANLDTARIHYSNLTLLASFHHTPRSIRHALEFIESGVISAKDFVDGESPLTQLPDLFRSMAQGNRAVKTLVHVRD